MKSLICILVSYFLISSSLRTYLPTFRLFHVFYYWLPLWGERCSLRLLLLLSALTVTLPVLEIVDSVQVQFVLNLFIVFNINCSRMSSWFLLPSWLPWQERTWKHGVPALVRPPLLDHVENVPKLQIQWLLHRRKFW